MLPHRHTPSRAVPRSTISRSRFVFVLAYTSSLTTALALQNAASQLERLLNRWAADVVRTPPASLSDIYLAALTDITGSGSYDALSPEGASAIQVQNILRHALTEVISTEIINVLMVTNSEEANIQLTRIHEHLFASTSSILVRASHVLNSTLPPF